MQHLKYFNIMAITKIPEGLKLNKFEMAVLPHARKLVSTFGYASSPNNQYSGDEALPHQTDKVHTIQQGANDALNSVNE